MIRSFSVSENMDVTPEDGSHLSTTENRRIRMMPTSTLGIPFSVILMIVITLSTMESGCKPAKSPTAIARITVNIKEDKNKVIVFGIRSLIIFPTFCPFAYEYPKLP